VRTARAGVCHSRCVDQKTLDSSDKVEWESSLEAVSVLRCRVRTYLNLYYIHILNRYEKICYPKTDAV